MPENNEREDSEAPLSDKLLEIWQRRRWLAMDCLMVPLAAALAIAAFLPNIYRSNALVEVAHESPDKAAQNDSNNIEGQLQRLNEENLSRAHLQTLITKFDLYPAMRRKGSVDGAIDQMRKDVQIEIKDAEHVWGRSTVAFQVGFRGGNPERTAQVTNALANFYVDKSQEQGELLAKSVVAGLQAQADEMKVRLDAQSKAVNDFLSVHLQELPDQVRANLAAIDRYNAQLGALNHVGHTRMVMVSQPQNASAPPVVEEVDTEMARLMDQLSELRGRVTDQYPDVVHLKQQIAALQAAQRRRSMSRPLPVQAAPANSVQMQIPDEPLPEGRSTQDQRRQLRAMIAATEQNIYSAPKREVELQSLLAPLNATRASYSILLERLDDARRGDSVDKQRALDPFRVLDAAVTSRAAAGPDRIKIAGAGIVFAILFALLAVFLAEKLDTSFHSIDELRAFTRVPVLASVPNIVAPDDTLRLRRRARLTALVVAIAAVLSVGASYLLAHNNESLVLLLSRGHA